MRECCLWAERRWCSGVAPYAPFISFARLKDQLEDDPVPLLSWFSLAEEEHCFVVVRASIDAQGGFPVAVFFLVLRKPGLAVVAFSLGSDRIRRGTKILSSHERHGDRRLAGVVLQQVPLYCRDHVV